MFGGNLTMGEATSDHDILLQRRLNPVNSRKTNFVIQSDEQETDQNPISAMDEEIADYNHGTQDFFRDPNRVAPS
jgi:hypothetical protein